LAERGITVTQVSVCCWCGKPGSKFVSELRCRQPKQGDTWHLDEVFRRLNGALHDLWRAVDHMVWC
jgi:putative transposase